MSKHRVEEVAKRISVGAYRLWPLFWLVLLTVNGITGTAAGDQIKDLQTQAIADGKAVWGHWGPNPEKYTGWKTHSNRLIPVYTFGTTLDAVAGEHSPYRSADRLTELYGRVPAGTLNPTAEYVDQTDVCRLQQLAADAGKKYIVLIVFDGMDWQTTWAAAIHQAGQVGYREGRGTGLLFQDYRGAVTDFGCFVSSPHNHGTSADVNAQVAVNPGGLVGGGYDPVAGGPYPWQAGNDPLYLLGISPARLQAVTDSAASAASMTCGIKTYNDAINVDFQGKPVEPIARRLQQQGRAIGVVTSVPISHATPACAYANNVHRDDYQDLTRDLVGRPSVAHRGEPLPGVDVLLGAGWGVSAPMDDAQGSNFEMGNRYITATDLAAIDVANGGRYRVVQRTAGVPGASALACAARQAADGGQRLFGFFGTLNGGGHLPFRTADGAFDPTVGVNGKAEQYTAADLDENPQLSDLTAAALTVLEKDPDGFWLMIEAGDVDWANHDDNIDNSIGAVVSGDEAFRTLVQWVERHQAWDQTAIVLTADHGHYLVLDRPEALVEARP